MPTLLEDPLREEAHSPVERLQTTMAAVRLSLSRLGVRKTLSAEQRAEAAEPFGASAKFISAAKKLLDTDHPAYKEVTAIRGRIVSFWKSMSLPYPEPGVRLIRHDGSRRPDARKNEGFGRLPGFSGRGFRRATRNWS